MDKKAKSPLPPKTGQVEEDNQRQTPPQRSADPTFVRGTIDPPTKKGGTQ
jgi:hypothetical protein